MDLRQLRSLVYIADSGSLSRAAEMLRTSQPALSQHLKHLEAELGVELLHRHARGVTLTDLGHIFCEHARTILKDVERARDSVAYLSESPRGKVSLGFPTSVCRGLTPRLIHAVSERYPNISLHVLEGLSGTLDEWVQAGRLDVALLYDNKAFANIDLTDVMLEDLMLIANVRDPILRRGEISFSELQALPLVLPSKQHVLRNLIERLSARENITPNVAIDCDSLTGMIELVRRGYMTVLPHFALLDEIERKEVGAIPILNPTPSWRLSVVVSQRTINMRSAQVIAETLIEMIKSLVADGTWRHRSLGIERSARAAPRGR
jgi:LysR family nitrogen assimilation transcriptional regulator